MNVVRRTYAVMVKRSILVTLVQRDLRVRYSNSVLGYVWTILDPLLMSLIYFFVFTYLFIRKDDGHQPYFLFLIIGLLSWQWFSGSVTDTSRALGAESRLVRSTNLPREIWVFRVVVAKGVEYVFSLPVLIGFTLIYILLGDVRLDYELLYFPLGLALEFALLIGVGLILAPVTALVNDMARVVRIVLRMLFYLTPVIYTHNVVPHPWDKLLWLNPMSSVLELMRAGFFAQSVTWHAVMVGVGVTVVTVFIGFWVFARLERAVLKEI